MSEKRRFQRWSGLVILLSVIWVGDAGLSAVVTDQRGDPGGNVPEESRNVVEGFTGNAVLPRVAGATISGGGSLGFPNQVTAPMGTIGGGGGNQAGALGTVGGGWTNVATGFRATIGGGGQNTSDRDSATVGGGFGNIARGSYATIGGGTFNAAEEVNATVGGGSGNQAKERHSTVGGGTVNIAAGFAGTVGGGVNNKAMATYSSVGGGIANTVRGIAATVSGGTGNRADGEDASISGGMNNHVTAPYGTVAGGRVNIAGNPNGAPGTGAYATVGGGTGNRASGSFSVVPGGSFNIAASDSSFAAGHRAVIDATHQGTFLYADSSDVHFHSLAANEFAVRATGGFRLVTAIDPAGNPAAGVRLSTGGGSWESFSDRKSKTNVSPVAGREILEKLIHLPVTTWSYHTQSLRVRHIGPTAQDFYALFGLGEGNAYVNTVDVDGVALAAIQGLHETVVEKEVEIKAHQCRIELLEAEMAALRSRLVQLEAKMTWAGEGAETDTRAGLQP